MLHLEAAGRERCRDERHEAEEDCDPTEHGLDGGQLGDGADRRADDESEHGEPEGRAEGLAAPGARRAQRQPGERTRPRDGAREALGEPGRPEHGGRAAECEGDTRESRGPQGRARPCASGRSGPRAGRPGCRRSWRPRRRRRRAGPGPGSLREGRQSSANGDQRHRSRRASSCPQRHDDADAERGGVSDLGEPTWGSRHRLRGARTREMPPSRWPFCPASRFVSAGAGADRAVDLRCSVLGARGNARAGARATSRGALQERIGICEYFSESRRKIAIVAVCSTKDWSRNSPSRSRLRPLHRPAFRFRVPPLGEASSSGAPCSAQRGIYAAAGPRIKTRGRRVSANCDRLEKR